MISATALVICHAPLLSSPLLSLSLSLSLSLWMLQPTKGTDDICHRPRHLPRRISRCRSRKFTTHLMYRCIGWKKKYMGHLEVGSHGGMVNSWVEEDIRHRGQEYLHWPCQDSSLECMLATLLLEHGSKMRENLKGRKESSQTWNLYVDPAIKMWWCT